MCLFFFFFFFFSTLIYYIISKVSISKNKNPFEISYDYLNLKFDIISYEIYQTRLRLMNLYKLYMK